MIIRGLNVMFVNMQLRLGASAIKVALCATLILCKYFCMYSLKIWADFMPLRIGFLCIVHILVKYSCPKNA